MEGVDPQGTGDDVRHDDVGVLLVAAFVGSSRAAVTLELHNKNWNVEVENRK